LTVYFQENLFEREINDIKWFIGYSGIYSEAGMFTVCNDVTYFWEKVMINLCHRILLVIWQNKWIYYVNIGS